MGNPFWFASISRRSLQFVLLLLSIVASSPEPARANDAETADVAVDLFVRGSQIAGLPITTTEAEIIKQIVTCGLAGTEVGSCVRNIGVATALKQIGAGSEITASANCLLAGKAAKTCIDTAVVTRLPEEARPMVSCMISGQGNIADCTKKFAEATIINKVPEDIRPAAACIIETGNAAKCSKDIIIQQVTSRLPPDMQDQAKTIVDCLGSGNPQGCVASAAAPEQIKPLVACATAANANVGQCMADFAAKDLPDGVAKNMVGCIGAGADFDKCAAQKGVTSAADLAQSKISQAQQDAIKTALALIDKLRPDAPYTVEPGRNGAATIKNIMMVADGIKKHDWLEFTQGAGPELVKIAGSVILSIFLTPALAGVLSPALEAMVNNDVAAANRALDAASKGDAVAFAQVVFEWYENSFIDKPCALIGSGADGACKAMSNTIKVISDGGADLAKKLLGAGKDILEWLGVWGTIDDVTTFGWNTLKDGVAKVGHVLGIGSDEWKAPNDCASPSRESPSAYLANHFLTCLPKTASSAVSGRNMDTAKLTADCNAYFNRCTDPKKRDSVAGMCSAMSASLSNMTSKVSDSMAALAKSYADSGIGMTAIANQANKDWLSSGGLSGDLCAADFWKANQYNFAAKCAAFVNGAFPLAPTNTAAGAAKACPALPTASGTSAQQQACIAALNGASPALKGALAGPDSELCKQQAQYVADHPCTATYKTMTVPGSGMKYKEITSIKCKDDDVLRKLPFDTARLPPSFRPKNSSPEEEAKTIKPLGPGMRLPKNFGHASPEEEVKTIKLPRSGMPSRLPEAAGPRLKKGPSAMDIIGDSMSDQGLNSVAGNAGGPGGLFIPRLQTRPSAVVRPPSGGTGGIGLTDGRTGNAPITKGKGSGGIGLVNGASGNAPVTGTGDRYRPVKSLGVKRSQPSDSVDDRIDYGGCSTCNKKPEELRVR